MLLDIMETCCYTCSSMKTIFSFLLLSLSSVGFCACSHTTDTTPDLQLLTKIQTANKMIQGGDGQSKETAIVLLPKTPDVIKQEYSLYHELYGTAPAGQVLQEGNGRHYDMLFDDDGRKLYFDITAYWKHTYGDK